MLPQVKGRELDINESTLTCSAKRQNRPWSVSLALQEAVPTLFVATQVYSPECLISPLAMCRTAELSSKVMVYSESPFRASPSLSQEISIGEDPATRHSNWTLCPSVCWMLVIFLGKEGGVLASEMGNVKQQQKDIPGKWYTWNKHERVIKRWREGALRRNNHLVQLNGN